MFATIAHIICTAKSISRCTGVVSIVFAGLCLMSGCKSAPQVTREVQTTIPIIGTLTTTVAAPIASNMPPKIRYYELVSGGCKKDDCLFSTAEEKNYPVGVAAITGYFLQIERAGFSNTETCNGFTVIDGSPALLRAWIALVNNGNSINSLDSLGQPIINLDFETLTKAEQDAITQSTADKSVRLVVFSRASRPMGATNCYSVVDVLRIE